MDYKYHLNFSSEHPIRLHFAIIAYKAMVSRSDRKHVQLAKEIYETFLRPKTGLCPFIQAEVRDEIGTNLRNLTQQQQSDEKVHPAELFDPCLPPLDTFLRRQFSLFVKSDEYLELFNNFSAEQQQLNDRGCDRTQNSTSSNKKGGRKPQQPPEPQMAPLTADTLLFSQHDREALVTAGKYAHCYLLIN